MLPAPVGTRIVFIPWEDTPGYKYGKGVLDKIDSNGFPWVIMDNGIRGMVGGTVEESWRLLELDGPRAPYTTNKLGDFPKKEGMVCPLLSHRLQSAGRS